MKKSQLRDIIKKSIKKLINEEVDITTVLANKIPTNIHIYEGCNIQSGTNTGAGNGLGHSPGESGWIANQWPPSYNYAANLVYPFPYTPLPPPGNIVAYEAMLTHNSNVLHDLWNTPNVGQVIRFCQCETWDRDLNPDCQCTCMKYLGSTNAFNPDSSFNGQWNNGQLDAFPMLSGPDLTPQPNYVFNSCEDCDTTVEYNKGCLDQNAINYLECCPDPTTGIVDPNCTANVNSECCVYNNIPGCFNSNASNYGECCNGDPNCSPTYHKPECCVWEEKGCLDKSALNYGQCCWNPDPECFPIYPVNEECCEYERIDPLPCKKCCCKEQQITHPITGDDELKEQINIGGCEPNTTIMLSPTAEPCECPQDMMETPCKPPPTPLQERFKKLANIK